MECAMSLKRSERTPYELSLNLDLHVDFGDRLIGKQTPLSIFQSLLIWHTMNLVITFNELSALQDSEILFLVTHRTDPDNSHIYTFYSI